MSSVQTLDDEARVELLCYLVVAQLVAWADELAKVFTGGFLTRVK